MPNSAHIAFAKDVAGNIIAASDDFATKRNEQFCVACGRHLSRRFGPKNRVYFAHERGLRCPAAAHIALRAAAQQVLESARFLRAPLLSGNSSSSARTQGILLQWATSASDVNVVNVPVDFLADTQFGMVAFRFDIAGFAIPADRTTKVLPDVPVLSVRLPSPETISRFAPLRQALLHDVSNKIWVKPPTTAFTQAQPQAEARVEADTPDAKPWHRAITFANSGVYRQLTTAGKLEVLERSMDLPCERWPSEVDIEIENDDVFGVDRRIWQADVLARFILSARPLSSASDFSVVDVSQWLRQRYDTVATSAEVVPNIAKTYLSKLVGRGILGYREAEAEAYSVLRHAPDERERFVWETRPNLSSSQLRVLSNQVGLHIPVSVVQLLLDSFNGYHPVGTVSDFVGVMSRLLHASPQLVTALLLDAHLVREVEFVRSESQQTLF
ncbi:hypothetical protein [Burkholderia cenocepacia]|uniref:hypothetical protein n=1 Tax=Burkholderia cenocepacia TaxID=95486 RepID=UPI000761D4CC|nr:hypothetical protein [Burkholderia cenocepacia]KWU26281.1 hypothetical protein AS149_25150 [Burkholderia cenocepacia]